jgi:O-antigen ligase
VIVATVPLMVLLFVGMFGPPPAVSPFSAVALRFYGLSVNPNQLAILIAGVPFFALWLFWRARSAWEASGWMAAAGAATMVGLATHSDALVAGWLGAVAVVVLVFLAAESGRRRQHAALLPLAAIACLVLGATLFLPTIDAAWVDLNERGDQVNVRMALWTNGIAAIRESPLVGHGPGAYSGSTGPFQGYEAHNTLIDWGASAGLSGLALLVAALGWLVLSGIRERAALLTGAMAASLGLAMFHYVARHPTFWMVLIAAHVLADRRPAATAPTTIVVTGGVPAVRD